jgi:rRNA biogenesis protein RRP5
MAAQKRSSNDAASNRKSKKPRTEEKSKPKENKVEKSATALTLEEVDFPRGGGTSFTPLEVKAIRAEAVKEADEALFKV